MCLNKWKGYHFKIYFKFSILLFAIFIALSSGYFFFTASSLKGMMFEHWEHVLCKMEDFIIGGSA